MTFGLMTQIQTPRPWGADAKVHLVTDSGVEVLSTTPRDLVVVG